MGRRPTEHRPAPGRCQLHQHRRALPHPSTWRRKDHAARPLRRAGISGGVEHIVATPAYPQGVVTLAEAIAGIRPSVVQIQVGMPLTDGPYPVPIELET